MSDLVGRIETTIKQQGLTFNRVEHDCGLGNGTIKRWSDQSPRLDKLVAVANYLKVSLDYLVHGSLQSESYPNGEAGELTCDGSPLTDLEADLVAMFRLLPPSHQEEVFNLTHFKYKTHVEKEKGSIYSTYFDASNDAKSDPADGHERRSGTA